MTVPRLFSMASLLALLICCASIRAQSKSDFVESGHQGLQKAGRFPWYDAESDSVRSVTLPPTEKPPQPSNWVANPSNWNWDWDWFWDSMQVLAWFGLVLLFVLLCFLICRNLGILPNNEDQNLESESNVDDEHRISQLPFPVQKEPIGDLLNAARECYARGEFEQAIVFLFSHQLVQLDKAHLIRLTKGRTNRQYLSELESRPKLKQLLTQTTIIFEDVFFGNRNLSKERFDLCWNRLADFDNQVRQTVE